MNVNEYGVIFAFSTGFNMASNSSLQLQFWKPDNPWSADNNLTPSLTKVAALGVGSLVTTLGTFVSNMYVTYTFINGDVNQAGQWASRVVYNDATQHLISDVAYFTVSN